MNNNFNETELEEEKEGYEFLSTEKEQELITNKEEHIINIYLSLLEKNQDDDHIAEEYFINNKKYMLYNIWWKRINHHISSKHYNMLLNIITDFISYYPAKPIYYHCAKILLQHIDNNFEQIFPIIMELSSLDINRSNIFYHSLLLKELLKYKNFDNIHQFYQYMNKDISYIDVELLYLLIDYYQDSIDNYHVYINRLLFNDFPMIQITINDQYIQIGSLSNINLIQQLLGIDYKEKLINKITSISSSANFNHVNDVSPLHINHLALSPADIDQNVVADYDHPRRRSDSDPLQGVQGAQGAQGVPSSQIFTVYTLHIFIYQLLKIYASKQNIKQLQDIFQRYIDYEIELLQLNHQKYQYVAKFLKYTMSSTHLLSLFDHISLLNHKTDQKLLFNFYINSFTITFK